MTLIAATLALGLCFKAIVDAYLGGTADWRVALSFVTRRLHSIIWVTLLGGLIAVIGFIFCIVPGVYLYISFVVAVPVLLTERLKGRKALSRSRALVKGRWWSVFAAVLIGGILTSIVSGALSALDGIVAVTSDDPSSIGAIVVAFLTGTIASMVTTPLTAAIATVIYIDLRVRHEAFDLQLLAGQLGVDPPEGPARFTRRRCCSTLLLRRPDPSHLSGRLRLAGRPARPSRTTVPPTAANRTRPIRARTLSHANEEARGLGCGGARDRARRSRAGTRRNVGAGSVACPAGSGR